MAKFLADDQLWRELRRQAARAKTLTALVAYVGQRPERLLRWPRKSILVADLSERTVSQGASSAKGALRLRLVKKIRVYHADGLHAKVYLFDRTAVVCS